MKAILIKGIRFYYAKGNNIEITQEELEEYTERYTVMGYSENVEDF